MNDNHWNEVYQFAADMEEQDLYLLAKMMQHYA